MDKDLNNIIIQQKITNINESGILFIQRWRELLNPGTLDSYMCRYMCTCSLLDELINTIIKVREGIIYDSNLKPITEECLFNIKNDIVLNKYCPINQSQYARQLSTASNHNNKSNTLLNFLSVVESTKKDIVNMDYLGKTFAYLKENIDQNNFNTTNKLCSILAVELINNGWSRKSLSWIWKKLFIDNENKSFEEIWQILINYIYSEKSKTIWYFKIKNQDVLFDHKITTGRTILDKYTNINRKCRINESDNYIEIETNDRPENFFKAYEDVQKQITKIESREIYYNNEVDIKNVAQLIVLPDGRTTIYNQSKTHNKSIYSSYYETNKIQALRECIDKLGSHNIFKRIENVFNQYSLAHGQVGLESKYICLWTALESLIVTQQKSNIIDHFTSHIPPILCLDYINKIIKNLISDFKRCKVPLESYGLKSNDYGPENKIGLLQILRESQSNTQYTQMLSDAQSYTLLNVRIKEISKWLSEDKKIYAQIEQHHKNVEWQLQRLYSFRNSQVHNAVLDGDIQPLLGNIDFYIRSILDSILTAIKSDQMKNIEIFYSSKSSDFQIYMEKLKSNSYGLSNTELLNI